MEAIPSPRRSRRPSTAPPRITTGLFWALLGVLVFSLTLPATKRAVLELDPAIVSLGRAMVAAVLAAGTLAATRPPLPAKGQLIRLLLVAAGTVVGFPLLSSWAVARVPASHGAIVLGLIPVVTAIYATLRTNERPSAVFWAASMLGSAVVLWYVLAGPQQSLVAADAALLLAVVIGAIGYGEGGLLARDIGSWQVICWALILAAPAIVVPVALLAVEHGLYASPTAWACFGYVSVFSMFLGFFAWNRGLAIGGVARASQVQLLQPLFTVSFSGLLLGEGLSARAGLALAAVTVLVGVASRARFRGTYGKTTAESRALGRVQAP